MSRKVRIVLAGLLAGALLLLVMFVLAKGEEREVKNVVLTYNTMLLKAHRELKSSWLKPLTSARQFMKVDNYLAFLLKNRMVLQGDILDIRFTGVTVEKDRSVVTTKERWKYFYVEPATRKPVSEVYDVQYGNTYYLQKEQGHWVVDDLESTELGGKTEG